MVDERGMRNCPRNGRGVYGFWISKNPHAHHEPAAYGRLPDAV